jgi:prepilin-type N-terminal cleavage/methylation domain-containing protein
MSMNKRGFTIIELLLAMTFFSFIMMIVVVGFMQLVRTYRGGIIRRDTQIAIRQSVDRMTDQIHNSEIVKVSGDANESYICTDNIWFILNTAGNSGKITSSDIPAASTSCGDTLVPASDQESLFDDDKMQLLYFKVEEKSTSRPGAAIPPFPIDGINLRLIIGTRSDDGIGGDEFIRQIIDGGATDRFECDSGIFGSQYCAITDITTSIARRAGDSP